MNKISSRADLLNLPLAVHHQGQSCPARADPHGREAVRLLDVPPTGTPCDDCPPSTHTPCFAQFLDKVGWHRPTIENVGGRGREGVNARAVMRFSIPVSSANRQWWKPQAGPGDLGDPFFFGGSTTRVLLRRMSGPTRARSRALARSAPGGLPPWPKLPRKSGPTRARRAADPSSAARRSHKVKTPAAHERSRTEEPCSDARSTTNNVRRGRQALLRS